MHINVRLKFVSSCKCFWTYFTLVWFFTLKMQKIKASSESQYIAIKTTNFCIVRYQYYRNSHCCYLPVWILTCIFKALDVVNANEHWSHLYGLCPVCILICVRRPLILVNNFRQRRHLKDLPSLTIRSSSFIIFGLFNIGWNIICRSSWVSMCFWKFPNHVKPRSHTLHVYGFVFEWIIKWRCKSLDLLNSISHFEHFTLFILILCSVWSCSSVIGFVPASKYLCSFLEFFASSFRK